MKDKKCPTCGYKIENETVERCPRCYTIIQKHPSCTDCKGCSIVSCSLRKSSK